MTVMFEAPALPLIPEVDSDVGFDMHSPSIKQSPSDSSPRSTDTPATSVPPSSSSGGSAHGSLPPSASAQAQASKESRRPRRKSTLTQQQKNQKRQRATQQQLTTLEEEFNKNPTPGAAVRERIALEINMTERSVQIWFQNKRAKIKNAAKKSLEAGEDCDSIPESMRLYLARQALDHGKPLLGNLLGRNAAFGNGLMAQESNSTGKVVIHHFYCQSLSIGSWRRVGQNAMDLIAFFSPEKEIVTYYIHNDAAGYKIEYPFSSIKNITTDTGDSATNGQNTPQKPNGGLIIELIRPPLFFMDSAGTGGFYQCGDFTEDQQASQVLTHYLGGHHKVLSDQVSKLLSLESFQNRFKNTNQFPTFDTPVAVASAPVSPPHRPSSAMAAPSVPMPMFPDQPVNLRLQGPGGPRGHKRQRSRSVPVAVDFNMLHSGMNPFSFQPPPSAMMNDMNLFAPIPQHQANFAALNPNLRIDTSTPYGMDYRQYPMSATTVASDFASPNLFQTTNSNQDPNTPALTYGPQFTLPFLSPLPEAASTIAPSVSPISAMSHTVDPNSISDRSPPMITIQSESDSPDNGGVFQDMQPIMDDESLALSEMYSKQQITLPFGATPAIKDNDEMELLDMVSFTGFDPSQLDGSTM